MIYKKYPQMVIFTFLQSIWTALTPYVGIYLSALIIDELAGPKNVNRLKILVLITVLSGAIIAFIFALLQKKIDIHTSNLYYKFEKFYTDKLFDMDFASIDDIKTHELLSTIKQNQMEVDGDCSALLITIEPSFLQYLQCLVVSP